MDIISAIEELSGYASRELNKLLKDSDNFTIQCSTVKGSLMQIDVERLSSSLPLHLIAVLMSPDMGMPLVHLLRAVRLLHALSDLASRHTRLEQILMDDVKFSEQILDLVFFMLIVLARYEQGKLLETSLPFLHSALVAGTLHLLPGYISSQWHDLVHVLLAHPKVDIFMDIAYDAVHVDIRFLHIKLSSLSNDVMSNKSSLLAAERTTLYLCQQCEASLQVLLSLCQQKLFRDCLLKNKDLCKSGGILLLARTALRLNSPECFKESSDIVAAVSRIKSKVLSILLQLCEAESISYLDEVAGSSKSMHLAKSVTLEIVGLLKTTFRGEAKCRSNSLNRSIPKGLVLLNSLRLADIFSDDSNFRSFFMTNTIEVLVEILAIPHEEFQSSWCSVDIPMIEEDANVEYDPFTAAGVALVSFTGGCEIASTPVLNETSFACHGVFNGIHSVTYAQQRTSYLVKVIANLHCFIPNICEEEERDLFLNKFHKYLLMDNEESLSKYPPNSVELMAATICKNLSSLSNHAASLIPNLLNEEDVHLLRLFSEQLRKLNPQQADVNLIQEPFVKDEDGTLDYKLEDRLLVQPSLQTLSKFPDYNSNNVGQNSSKHLEARPAACRNFYNSGNKEDSCLACQANNPWTVLCIDSQGAGESAPAILRKLDSVDQEECRKDKDVDMKQGVSEGSLDQELDDLDLDQNRRKNILLDTRSSSESLRVTDKEIQNSEMEITEQNSKGDVDQRPETAEIFRKLDYAKEGGFQEDDKTESVQGEEKYRRKRKRNIMNEKQILLIEKALLEEPEMQRNHASLQAWADKLSSQGSEITSSQLKNWVNNRKARLARAARENRAPSEGENTGMSQYYDSPESAGEEYYIPTSRGSAQLSQSKPGGVMTRAASAVAVDHSMTPSDLDTALQHDMHMIYPVKSVPLEPEQLVLMVDAEGKEVGNGKVSQVKGRWRGKSLEDRGTCVVDVLELKIEKWKGVQHPSEDTGTTFEEAASRNSGIMRVEWDSNNIFALP